MAPRFGASLVTRTNVVNASELVRVIDDAFDASEIDALYMRLARYPRMPTNLLYVAVEDVERLAGGDNETTARLEGYLPRELVAFVPRYVERVRAVAPTNEPIVGVEIFLSQHASSEPQRHAGFHVDSNEPTWDSARVAWGSILHLGPKRVLEGGTTVLWPTLPVPAEVMAHCFQPTTYEQLDALSSDWLVVERRQNRLLAFDGRLPHFAGRCRAIPSEPRVALVVTGWATIPRFASPAGFSHLTAAEYRAFTELPEAVLDGVRRGEAGPPDLVSAMQKLAAM